MGTNSSFLDPLLSPTIQDDGDDKIRRANINYIGFTVEDDPTNDATKITNTGGGGGELALADHAAFRALSSPPTDGTVIHFQNPIGTFVYSSTEGAGQADDDATILKRTATSTGSNGRAYSVDGAILPSIAALRLAVSGTQTSVSVQAFATGGDGGGGIFDKISGSGTDDGGTIIVPTGITTFYYKRRYAGTLNVRWFGAKGVGTGGATEDTTAILAAWAALGPDEGAKRGRIFFPQPSTFYALNSTWLMKTSFTSAIEIEGECASPGGHNGVQIKWNGSAGAPMVHMLGAWNIHFKNLHFHGNSTAKYVVQEEGDVARGVGTSTITWTDCLISNPRDNSGDRVYLFGEATGFQCDTTTFVRTVLYATPGSVNAVCFEQLGGNNAGLITWIDCVIAFGARGIIMNAPVFTNRMIGGGFAGITVACMKLAGLGTPFLMSNVDVEQCTGKFVEGVGASPTSGNLTVQECHVPITTGTDDVVIDFTGMTVLRNNTFINLRGGAAVHEPKIVLSSGYAYGGGGAGCGIESVGNTYFGSTGTYIPVYDEGGTAILTAARMASSPAPVWSRGDVGGPLGGLQKLPPVVGRTPDSLDMATGILHSTAGVLSSSKIIDADVSSGAAIDSDKITYAGKTVALGNGFLSVGAGTVAATGNSIRGDSGFQIKTRGNGAYDLNLVEEIGVLDWFIFGDTTNVLRLDFQTKTGGLIENVVGAVTVMKWTEVGTTVGVGDWVFANDVTPFFQQGVSASGAGRTMKAFAQQGASSTDGGVLDVGGGAAGSSGLKGGFKLRIGGPSGDVLMHAAELASNRRVLARYILAGVTTTQMPANTGDGVGFVGECTTAPTADPVGGVIEYVSSGHPYRRHTDGTVD